MNLATFRESLLKPSVKLRHKFLYDSVDYTSLLVKNGLGTIRRDVNLSAGKALVTLNNAGGWWNFLKATNVALGGTAEVQVYVAGDPSNVYTLFKGVVKHPQYDGSLVNLNIKDHNSSLLDRKVGSNESPATWYQGTATGEWADVRVWDLLTRADSGQLDSTSSPSNTDIDYASFVRWRDNHTRPNNYEMRGRPTGQTVGQLLMTICQMTHSYIWVNNDGLIEFAPPYEAGYTYDESNTGSKRKPGEGRGLDLPDNLIRNNVTVRYGYNFSTGSWFGSVNDVSAVSVAKFGTFPKTVEGRIFVHSTEASATSDLNATLAAYAFPLRFFDLTAGYPAMMEDLGRTVTVSDTLKDITNAVAYTESIIYNLNTWEMKIKARWPW